MPKLEIIRELPSVEYLKACFSYDPDTGELRWKRRPREHFTRPADYARCNAMSGEIAGYLDNGYRRVSLNFIEHKVHRVIWKLMTGNDPSGMLDHKDGNRSNNRWLNLREATQSGQTRNTKLRADNAAGYRGVSRHHGAWRATIFKDGKQTHLGYFDTAEEASAAYEEVAREYFGEFYRNPKYR